MSIYGRPGNIQGFTLIEMLMVIVIIMILAGMITSAFYKARITALEKKKSSEKLTIAAALRNYRYEYQKWPCPQPADLETAENQVYQTDPANSVVINDYLMKNLPDRNKHGIAFLNIGDFAFDPATSNIVDYKKDPYKITISFTNDNVTVE